MRFILSLIICLAAFYKGESVDHSGSDANCPINIKVLNAVNGTPAANLHMQIYRRNADLSWHQFNTGVTGINGEVHNLITEADFIPGMYKIHFNTADYWRNLGYTPFHECVNVIFRVDESTHQHYTLALLLSPYSYSTTGMIRNPH
ncbi:transthyretin [Chiloscyllium plagiosum]|uniref:transthyretin n=1 Tax=Chiloscyllium plagiosum TaxID=36176 RepID=UPI001CB7EF73|nr:transthyretin [Chiloscyllium plagiosum]